MKTIIHIVIVVMALTLVYPVTGDGNRPFAGGGGIAYAGPPGGGPRVGPAWGPRVGPAWGPRVGPAWGPGPWHGWGPRPWPGWGAAWAWSWGWGYPFYWGYPYWGAPYAYYAGPPAVVEQAPQTYTEQEDSFFWYYCQNPRGYYPYVKECPGGWTKVAPTPTTPGQ